MSRKVCEKYLQDCVTNNFTLFEIYISRFIHELIDNIFVTIRFLKFSSKICVILVTTYNQFCPVSRYRMSRILENFLFIPFQVRDILLPLGVIRNYSCGGWMSLRMKNLKNDVHTYSHCRNDESLLFITLRPRVYDSDVFVGI